MNSQDNPKSPRKPTRDKSTSDKKSFRPDREPRRRVVPRRQEVGSAARDEQGQRSSGVDTLQKVVTKRAPQDQPRARVSQSKELGVYSAALLRIGMEEADERAIREEGTSRVRVTTKKRQKAHADTTRGTPGEASTAALEGAKTSGQPQRSPAKPWAEEKKATPEEIGEASSEASRNEYTQPLKKGKQGITALADKALRYALQHWTRAREAVGTCGRSSSSQSDEQPITGLAPAQHDAASLQAATAQHGNLLQFLQVRYQNAREGLVDDITLDELIGSRRISHFYRPSEESWVDISANPVRINTRSNTTGLWRRASDRERVSEREEKPRHLFSGRFRRRTHRNPPKKEMTPQECFQQGFVAFHMADDCEAAIRAFAQSIQLDPTFERAYVHRGLAYEKFGNVQQAIEDYSRALLLNPSDGKLYYLRGLSFRRLGMDVEATTDLRTASDLHYWPAYNLLKSTRICL